MKITADPIRVLLAVYAVLSGSGGPSFWRATVDDEGLAGLNDLFVATKTMKFVWDEPKRLASLDKHGLDFADPNETFFENAVVLPSHNKAGARA